MSITMILSLWLQRCGAKHRVWHHLIKLCEDLMVDPEDVVLLAVAFELKSPKVGEWNRKGWVDGWKNLGYTQFVVISPLIQAPDATIIYPG
jgi:hypothetical protein